MSMSKHLGCPVGKSAGMISWCDGVSALMHMNIELKSSFQENLRQESMRYSYRKPTQVSGMSILRRVS